MSLWIDKKYLKLVSSRLRNGKWKDDKARKKVLEILNANSEDDEFTSKVRQKLSNILFS